MSLFLWPSPAGAPRSRVFPAKIEMKTSAHPVLRALLLTMLAAIITTRASVELGYHSSKTLMPATWSETGKGITTPRAPAAIYRWPQFNDPLLDHLIGHAAQSNPAIRPVESRVRKASLFQPRGGLAQSVQSATGLTITLCKALGASWLTDSPSSPQT